MSADTVDMNIIRNIYEHMGDEYSKDMFVNRLLYSLTGDNRYIKKVIKMTKEGIEFYQKLEDEKPKKVIFSAGIWGQEIARSYPDIKFECFADNNGGGGEIQGIPVVSFEQYIEQYKDAIVVIATRLYYAPIYEQLLVNGIPKDNIINAGKMIDEMSIRQYFDLPELKEHMNLDGEVFVDGGSFDGRTSTLFMDWCEGNYKKVWAFEPDETNCEKCTNALKKKACKDFDVETFGLWDTKTKLHFKAISNGASKIAEDGDVEISTVRMDDVIKEPVTFIKMDIEGSEYRALLGARNIIESYKPKLAISIYHKSEDIWQLPQLILEMNSEYKLYLRHYSTAAAETVMYAI